MPSHKAPFLVALLATACYTQTTPNSFKDHIANLVLAEESATSNVDCGRYYDDVIPSAVGFRFFSNYTPDTCYNIATLFSPNYYDSNTLIKTSDGIYSCDPWDRNCTNDFQANGINNFSPSANYSQVQVDLYHRDFSRDVTDFELKVFAGDKCEEDDAANPWYSWNGGCDNEGLVSSCRALPYSAKSFRLGRYQGKPECEVAAERGGSSRAGEGQLTTVVLSAMIVVGAMVAGL